MAAAAAAALASGIKSVANVVTQVYRDNQDKDQKCKTFPYSQRATECKGGKAHHMVPDRAWRSPGTRGKWTNIPPIDDAINTARESIPVVGELYKGGYYYSNMDEGKGLCICLSEDEHKSVHGDYDPAEKKIGLSSNPMHTAKLSDLEELAALKVSNATGCSQEKILQELRDHHRGLGFKDDTILRADPSGTSGITVEKMGEYVRGKRSGEIGF